MAGSIEQGKKAAQTNKRQYGEDYYVRIGAIGGKAKGIKGFAVDDRTLMDKLLGRPKRASWAGQKGGRISRKRKS